MSNLGWYQSIVTLMKKLGGPKKALGLIGTGIAVSSVGLYECLRRAVVKLKDKRKQDASNIYTINNDARDNQGLTFKQYEQFLLLEFDYSNDMALIEKPFGSDNVFAVSFVLMFLLYFLTRV